MNKINPKVTVTLSLPQTVFNDFKELQEIVKTKGLNLTMSGILQESLEKYLKAFKPVIDAKRNNRDISQADLFKIISDVFSELSNELQKISGD